MKKDSIYVIGAGNHAKVILSMFEACGIDCAGIYDDNESIWGETLWNIPITGPVSGLPDEPGTMAVIAIGDNNIRRDICAKFKNVCWPVIIHPGACVHSSVRIGSGTIIFPGAIILADTRIGDHAIINTAAVINQDCKIGDFCHIAAACCLADRVTVEDGSLIGMGSVVISYVHVFSDVTVGAGSTVTNNLGPCGMYVGSPAKRILRPVLDS